MTNEQAIEILKELWRYERTDKYTEDEIRQALDMAISALSAEPCEDYISRQAVLDCFNGKVTMPYDMDTGLLKVYLQAVVDAINNLPSAEKTETVTEFADRCRECGKRYVKRRTGKWIDYSDEGYVECPYCQHATTCDGNIEELHYCFYCGAELSADMRGDNNE